MSLHFFEGPSLPIIDADRTIFGHFVSIFGSEPLYDPQDPLESSTEPPVHWEHFQHSHQHQGVSSGLSMPHRRHIAYSDKSILAALQSPFRPWTS